MKTNCEKLTKINYEKLSVFYLPFTAGAREHQGDGMQLLLQAEEDTRRANRNARLVHNARFRYPACLEELTFDSQRGLERQQVMQLATCAYINDGQPVFITGPAGTGKS